MTHSEKKLVKRGIVLPLVYAVVIAVIYVSVFNFVDTPFKSDETVISAAQTQEITEITEFDGEINADTIRKSALSAITNDCIIGTINIGDTSYPIIYNAGAANAVGKFNINKNDTVVGEIGCCFMEVYKDNSAKMRLLAPGDTITIDTYYASYEYTVVETYTAENDSDLNKAGAGTGRALVLYTDSSVATGISNEYYVCVAEMSSGCKVNA